MPGFAGARWRRNQAAPVSKETARLRFDALFSSAKREEDTQREAATAGGGPSKRSGMNHIDKVGAAQERKESVEAGRKGGSAGARAGRASEARAKAVLEEKHPEEEMATQSILADLPAQYDSTLGIICNIIGHLPDQEPASLFEGEGDTPRETPPNAPRREHNDEEAPAGPTQPTNGEAKSKEVAQTKPEPETHRDSDDEKPLAAPTQSTKREAKSKRVAGPQSASTTGGAKTEGGAGSHTIEAKAAPTVVAEVFFPERKPEPRCNKCRKPLDPLRAQVTGKSSGSWRCSQCNCRAVQISRLPAWEQLREHLKEIPEAEVAQFWSNTHNAKGAKELDKLCSQTLESRRTQSEGSKQEGSYLPLSVYEKMGYDTQLISERCKDTKMCPILGKLFRISIESSFTATREDMVRAKTLQSVQGTRKADSERRPRKRERSPTPPRSRKGGRRTAEGKNPSEEMKIKKEEVELAKKQAAWRRDATKVLAKICPTATTLEMALKHRKVSHLPEFARGTGAALLQELKKSEALARDTIRGKTEWSTTIAEVAELCRKAAAHTAFVESMLKAAEQVALTA